MHRTVTLMAASALGAAIAVPEVKVPRALVHGLTGSPLVRADASDPKALFEELRKSVEEMRNSQESTVKAQVDVLTTEKIAGLNNQITNLEAALDELAKKAENNISPVVGDILPNPEYMGNFRAHMRKGDVNASMSIGSAPDGGYLAPVEWDRSITAEMKQLNPIRANAQVITISGQGFSRLYSTGAPGSGWVGETAARPMTTTPQLATLEFRTGELYANPAITQIALDDAAIDLEAWLKDEVASEFARQEGIAFLSGDGVNKPFGLLTYVTGAANAAKHPLGEIDLATTIGNLATGVAGDDILGLIYSLPAERVTNNAKLFMNRQLEAKLRLLKGTDGQYIWQPRLSEGVPSTLAGEPIVHLPGMATTGANAVVALYGDMQRTYLVVDRIGIRVLRDPYTNKPFVMFYTTKRVGGGVQNPEYMKALKLAAA